MKPEGNLNGPCDIHGYSDSEYAGDKYTCKSVKWCIVLINEVIITWCLQNHNPVTLSVTESEYSAVTEVYLKY